MYDIESPSWSLGEIDVKIAQFIALTLPEDILESLYTADDPVLIEILEAWLDTFDAQIAP